MDNINVEILEDGTLKFTTDAISGPNHANAEGFLRAMNELAGGEVKRQRRPHAHGKAHGHTHHHEDEHHTH